MSGFQVEPKVLIKGKSQGGSSISCKIHHQNVIWLKIKMFFPKSRFD